MCATTARTGPPLMPLDRFLIAQDAVYPQVLDELAAGRKRTHWMWFVFPQLVGLGFSASAHRYGIAGIGEAQRYLAHPILGARLAETTALMLDWAGKRSAVAILGNIDAMKFCSSMTLFELAALGAKGSEHFGHAIDAFCQGRRDERTLDLLKAIAAR